MNKVLAFVTTLIFIGINPLGAQDFDKGLAAYIADDFATARKELKPLAVQGYAKAQEMARSCLAQDYKNCGYSLAE